MAKMGRYCKAYPMAQLRAYSGWKEDAANTRKVKQAIDGVEIEKPRPMEEVAFLYLQEDLTVTDGVYLGENVIFAGDGEGWAKYCREELQFTIPEYLQERSGERNGRA